jgi:hypothetical protein
MPSYAVTFNFSYNFPTTGGTVTASGTITTNSLSGGTYTITGITGTRTVNGTSMTITGLSTPTAGGFGTGFGTANVLNATGTILNGE